MAGIVRLGTWVFPFAWPFAKKAFDTSVEWQVKRIFVWAKWFAHTKASVYWAVLCALAVSTAVGLWVRVPLIRPLLYVFVPLSLLTFFVLGWRNHGPSATKSINARLKFFWSFYTPTLGYALIALMGAIAIRLVEFL